MEPDQNLDIQSHLDAENQQKTKSLSELLLMMDDFQPVIPDAVTDYYLSKSGFQSDDLRVKRVLALAAQKFVSDIATDALAYCKLRQSSLAAKDKKTQAVRNEKKMVLTLEDLSAALSDQGVNIRRPDYLS